MSAIDPIGGPTPPSQRAKLMHAAQELESVFYAQLFKTMRETIPAEGGLLETSTGEQMFTAMLDDQVARMASTRHESELAVTMARQLGRNLPPEAAADIAAPTAGSGNDRGR